MMYNQYLALLKSRAHELDNSEKMSGESSHNWSIQKHEHGGHSSQNKRKDADEEPPYDCNDGQDYDDGQDQYDDEVGDEEWGDAEKMPPYNNGEWGDANEEPPYNDEEWGDGDEEPPYNDDEWGDADEEPPYNNDEWGDADEEPPYNDEEWGDANDVPPYDDELWRDMPYIEEEMWADWSQSFKLYCKKIFNENNYKTGSEPNTTTTLQGRSANQAEMVPTVTTAKGKEMQLIRYIN